MSAEWCPSTYVKEIRCSCHNLPVKIHDDRPRTRKRLKDVIREGFFKGSIEFGKRWDNSEKAALEWVLEVEEESVESDYRFNDSPLVCEFIKVFEAKLREGV